MSPLLLFAAVLVLTIQIFSSPQMHNSGGRVAVHCVKVPVPFSGSRHLGLCALPEEPFEHGRPLSAEAPIINAIKELRS